MMARAVRLRFPLLALAILALLAALWAGLLRLPWNLPVLRPSLPMAHGPLMVGGFLGTLIALERAVALAALGGRRWTYAGPLLAGLGGLALIVGLPGPIGPLLLALGSLVLLAAMLAIVRLQPALHSAVLATGAAAWLAGNLLWLAGRSIPQVVLWWAGFLVLTIVGERLELSRMLRPSRGTLLALLLAIALFAAGLVAGLADLALGTRLAGLGMIGMALWLLRFDIARRTVRKAGLTRYVALCLLAGYVWLLAAGLLGLRFGGATAGFQYDAFLHAVFIGFVLSMIFGHAPIIFPAVLGLAMPFRAAFYGPLILLHASLALRVAGDLLIWLPGRRWGGLLNEVALLLFLAMVLLAIRQGWLQSKSQPD